MTTTKPLRGSLSGMDAQSQLVRRLQFLAPLSKPGFSPTLMVAEHPQRVSQPRNAQKK